MNRFAPMILLVLGIGLAASFGARNGPSHNAWRQATGLHGHLSWVHALPTEVPAPEGEDAAKETAEQLAERHAESAKLAKRKSDALGDLVKAGAIGEASELEAAIEAAEAAIPDVPDPRTRVREWVSTSGLGFLLGVVLIGVGAFLGRKQQSAEAVAGGESGELDFPATVAKLAKEVAALADQANRIPMDDDAPLLRAAIEKLHNEEIAPLVDGRGVFIAQHGIGRFAEYFGPFSAGERNLARAWSALTDGHSVVASEALTNSAAAFGRAEAAWPK